VDIVIGRRGDSLSGTALVKSFRVRTRFGTLALDRKRIAWIHFRELEGELPDEVWLRVGDRLATKVDGTRLRFRASGGGLLILAYDDVHTLMLNLSPDRRAARLGG
jgi:hypothetical protein